MTGPRLRRLCLPMCSAHSPAQSCRTRPPPLPLPLQGCICCTVRGDLIRIMHKLLKRKNRFDAILIETTGLADPAPVAQTFFVDDELKVGEHLRCIRQACSRLALDGGRWGHGHAI